MKFTHYVLTVVRDVKRNGRTTALPTINAYLLSAKEAEERGYYNGMRETGKDADRYVDGFTSRKEAQKFLKESQEG